MSDLDRRDELIAALEAWLTRQPAVSFDYNPATDIKRFGLKAIAMLRTDKAEIDRLRELIDRTIETVRLAREASTFSEAWLKLDQLCASLITYGIEKS